MLEIRNLKKSFGDLPVLKSVDLSVQQGDVVAILGPSGSGKTTMLRCVNFLETATDGTMTFDGVTYQLNKTGKKDIMELRKKTAFVFQNYNLFLNKTAIQNVTETLNHDMSRTEHVRQLTDLLRIRNRLVEGFCKVVRTQNGKIGIL